MATVIARNVASIPQRTPAETWEVIIKLLAPDADTPARAELERISGVASASISSEATKEDAIIVYGTGPQVRVYCVFDDDAITGDGVNEDSLNHSPTKGDWRLSIPCLADDVEWIQKKLKALSDRVSARAVGEQVEYEKSKSTKASSGLIIDISEFLKS